MGARVTQTVFMSAVHCRRSPHSDGHFHEDTSDCRYQVAWSINPHMRIGAVDFSCAVAQHRALADALRRAGAAVVELPFVHGAFDSVFAKDPALVLERGRYRLALMAHQRHQQRRAEQAARASVYRALGYEVIPPPDVSWEGGDVAVLPSGGTILFGHGQRSDRRAAPWLEQHAGARVVPLELCDPHFFHLDVALGVLPDSTVMICEEAFAPESLHTLRALPGIRRIVPVPREDALSFALNVVAVGETILCGSNSAIVHDVIRSSGFRPVVAPLDQFHLSGGSAACLVAHLHSDARS
jgi:N-dimethylarginine dimethylaminohydrolase